MVDAMNKRYGTNIKLQFTQGGSFPANLGRLTQEYRAKQPSSTDLFLGSAGHMVSGLKSGWLAKIDWESFLERPAPDWESFLERPAPSNPVLPRVNPEGVGMAMVSRVVGIVYNTNLVKGDDVPQSIEDVLKPKFKGQIAVTPYVTGFYQFSAPDVLGIEFMRGFAKRLAPQIGGKIGCNSLDPVASGQFAMLIFDCGRDATVRYQRRGAPMAHAVPKEIIRDNVIDLGVPSNAKNKNVGKLLVNFLHTEEGQELLWKYGAYDLEVYPGSRSAKLIQKARKKYPDTKFLVSTVQRHLMLTKKGINVRTYQKEIRNIFRGATK
jgi:iron(III) transport system substrate-binding protein